MSQRLSKTLAIIAVCLAGLTGSQAALYFTDHRTSYLVVAVVAAIALLAMVVTTAIVTRRRATPKFPPRH